MKVGAWDRSKAMLSLAAGVAGEELKLRVKARLASSAGPVDLAARVAQAQLVAESLGRLKGALMKAGQLLSIDASDVLPPEAQAILAQLQGQAEPVDFEVILGVLQQDLGERLGDLAELDARAAASASIGQVHRAVAHGVPVAVKVQYPGIAESIDADLALVERLARGWLAVGRRQIDLRATFEELGTILHLEADYERERRSMERFGELLAGDPRFVVPQSMAHLSSRRVLTMTWEDGAPLGAWLDARPPHEDRLRLASSMLELCCRELFEWGLVQTDPNFGNFLVREGAREIVLLDFGATLSYDETFRADYARMLRALARGDAAELLSVGFSNGLLDRREGAETRAIFVEMMRLAVEPFVRPGAFAFDDERYAARSRELGLRFVSSLQFSAPPRQLLFLHRKLGGLFQLCKRMGVALDLRPAWDRFVAER